MISNWYNIETNTSDSDGGSGGPRAKKRAQLIKDLANEQLVLSWLLDYFVAQISEDGADPFELLLAGNPQISNPIYLYLNGFYVGVQVVPQNAIDLINLLLNHPLLELDQFEIEQILTFEPELIGDISSFINSYPNDPLALQIIHDFIDLQQCDTTNPCNYDDFDNSFELFYNFYNVMSETNLNWLEFISEFVINTEIDVEFETLMLIYQLNCTECESSAFEQEIFEYFHSNPEEDPDLTIDCSSFVFIPVGPNGLYQSCGVSNIDIDFFYEAPAPHGYGYVKMKTDVIYFEMPRIREDGTIISSYEASLLSTQAVTYAEEQMEIQFAMSGPFHVLPTLQSAFVVNLNTILIPFGGRATLISNYGVVPIKSAEYWSPGTGPCN